MLSSRSSRLEKISFEIFWKNWVVLFKHFFSKHEMRTFFHSKFYVQSGSMNLPQPVEKKSHHATGNFGVKITSLLLRRGEIYLQFCSKVFTSARDCQIAKQLLMSNASFERLNKNTVKLILLDGSEIHGTGTPPPKVHQLAP